MPEINEPFVGRTLAERFNIKGREIAPTLAPEIVPVVVVDSLRLARSSLYEFPFIGVGNFTGDAGDIAQCGIRNAAGSGRIVIIDMVQVMVLADGMVEFRTGEPNGTVVVGGTVILTDYRVSGVAGLASCERVSSVDGAGNVGSVFARGRQLANTVVDYPIGLIMDEGEAFHVELDTVAETLTANFYGREIIKP